MLFGCVFFSEKTQIKGWVMFFLLNGQNVFVRGEYDFGVIFIDSFLKSESFLLVRVFGYNRGH